MCKIIKYFFQDNLLYIIQIILGASIIIFGFVYLYYPTNLVGTAIIMISLFGLMAISMNYYYENKQMNDGGITKAIKVRNSWDVWFFSMPGVIVTLFFIGVVVNSVDVWKWIVVAFGGIVGIESLSSIIKKQLENQ